MPSLRCWDSYHVGGRFFFAEEAVRRSFKCSDQVSWGVVPDEASCDVPEPSFGEDDVVFDCSSLPDSSIVEGAKVGARVASKISRRVQNQKINHPRHRVLDTSPIDKVKPPQHAGTPTLSINTGRRALWANRMLVRRSSHFRREGRRESRACGLALRGLAQEI